MSFRDRAEAGEALADRLLEELPELAGELSRPEEERRPLVVALPRGGVPVAEQVARRLGTPMDVLVVRKIGSPENPEFGIGAIAESGYFWVNPEAIGTVRIDSDEMERTIGDELEQVRREIDLFREGRDFSDPRERTVIVVDDGIATGATVVVAARYLRSLGASRIVLAAPVCAKDTIPLLKGEADRIVCARTPELFLAVGSWYENFSQVDDSEVVRILRERRGVTEIVFPEDKAGAKGVVIFAHGSGSSRFSPRNRRVARQLNEAGFATLLLDLVTEEEAQDRERVFDIPFLSERLVQVTRRAERELASLGRAEIPIGYFGASTGAAAALWAAGDLGAKIRAIVSRGGRPDLAGSRLTEVRAPTLLIVGSLDHPVIEMNERAFRRLPAAELVLVEGATHLFEEPGALDEVARQSVRWFSAYLKPEREKKKAA